MKDKKQSDDQACPFVKPKTKEGAGIHEKEHDQG
jgi:hypothetical protein